jgi:hypothetical protein
VSWCVPKHLTQQYLDPHYTQVLFDNDLTLCLGVFLNI